MSKQKRGMFRGIVAAMAMAAVGFFKHLKWWGPNLYADPHLRDPYHHQRSRAGTTDNREGQKRLGRPKCTPGTVTYRDWLVRELGYDRRLADGYLFAYRNGYTIKMPMPQTTTNRSNDDD